MKSNQKQHDLKLNANQSKLVFNDGCARLNLASLISSALMNSSIPSQEK